MLNIMVIPDLVNSVVNDLVAAREGLPEPGTISTEGVGVGVTGSFRDEVGYTAVALRQTIVQLTEELRGAESAIRKTVEQLAASDESLAADAKEFLDFLDAAVKTDATPASPAASSGGGSNMRIQ